MKILMLSTTFPYPPTRGGTQVRTFHLLKQLSQQHSITLLTLRSPDIPDSDLENLRQWTDELIVFPRPQFTSQKPQSKLQRLGRFIWDSTPPHVRFIHRAEAQDWIDRAVAAGKFDVITCEHCINEIYVRPEWQSHLRTIVNIHSSVYATCKNQLQTGTSENTWRDRLNLPLLHRYEQRYCGKFSGIVVTTAEDAEQMRAFNATAPIAVIPNGVDFSQFPYRSADPSGHRLIFIGAMDNVANIDAARFLSLEVFPTLRHRYPEATLDLVGARPTPAVLELNQLPGITVTGQVASMSDYLHRSTVCVIPMRTGFGIKNKTLEAMAAGVPVVGSDRGLEGLAVDAPHVPLRALRANHVQDYLAAIDRLFQDAALRTSLSQSARQLIEQEYTWEQAGQEYEKAVMGEAKG